MYSDDLITPWYEALVGALPPLRIFDAHTHTGSNDPDGFRMDVDELLEGLAQVDGRAAVFTMHEPDGYPAANDRVLAEAAASGGRLVPFCRLDPHDDPAPEAERCLEAGARGIKLHPRAEQFRLEEPDTEPIFAIAHERGVPVIVHAGRGIPALGRDALELCERFPNARIILAHAGICDLGWIWRHAADHPNLFFDTAWWSATDLLTLFSLVPPGQIVLGSDAPYGSPLSSCVLSFRCALQAGVSVEGLESIAGGQMERLVAGDDPLDLGPAPGSARMTQDLLLERVAVYLVTALGRMMVAETGQEQVALARLACEVGEDTPQAPVCRSVLALLDRFERYIEDSGDLHETARGGRRFPGLHLIVGAITVAMTPDVALPAEPEPEAVGERTA